MIIITLKKGVVGVERIATDEEIILKDYDVNDEETDLCDELGYYREEEL
jgi:hypothetical protein